MTILQSYEVVITWNAHGLYSTGKRGMVVVMVAISNHADAAFLARLWAGHTPLMKAYANPLDPSALLNNDNYFSWSADVLLLASLRADYTLFPKAYVLSGVLDKFLVLSINNSSRCGYCLL